MIPFYLFDDKAFWVFSIMYTVGVAIIAFLLTWPVTWFAERPKINHVIPKSIVIAFASLIIFQFFHQAEHVTQMYQFAFLDMDMHDAHGILWFFDDEWNHFLFNWIYSIGMGIVFISLIRSLRVARERVIFAHIVYIYAFFALEGWHLIEHTYRIIHHLQGLCDQCPGIIDTLFPINRLVLHFWFNFFALIFPVAVFVWYRIPERIMHIRK